MSKNNNTEHTAWLIGDLAGAIGRGLLAGLAGTAAMTLCQMAEMKVTGRKGSAAPAEALEKTLPVKAPDKEEEKMKLAELVHYTYGTSWGIPLGIMGHAGLRAVPATLSHFGAVWGTALIMLPKLGLAPPVTEWSAKDLITDVAHHIVYASAAGAAYFCISRKQD